MWSRSELKERAKFVLFRQNTYWKDILALLILIGFAFCIGMVFSIVSLVTMLASVMSGSTYVVAGASASMRVFTILLSVAISLFLSYPLSVGFSKFFLGNRLHQPEFSDLFFAFNAGRYLRLVGSLLWLMLFIFLWSLPYFVSTTVLSLLTQLAFPFYIKIGLYVFFSLLTLVSLVPMIYKSISYSMTVYILSDNPDIGYKRALRLSISMTAGQVGRIFVFGLSYLGWILLGALACGIGVFFVMPYPMAGFAELYAKLRDNALRSGMCTFEELNFANPGPEFFV